MRLYGGDFVLDLRQWAHRRILLGAYERRELAAVLRLLPPGGVFVDVGANAGLFTVAAAGKAGRVVAVEPCTAVLALLRRNVARFGNVEVIAAAAGDGEGAATLTTPGETGWATLTEQEGVRVPTVSVAAELERRRVSRVNVVKIDAEGWEPVILRDLRHRLEQDRPAVLCELDPVLLARSQATPAELAGRLVSLGYRPFRFGRGGTRPVAATDAAGNVLFIPA
jgi:FkbM family methyltransferase